MHTRHTGVGDLSVDVTNANGKILASASITPRFPLFVFPALPSGHAYTVRVRTPAVHTSHARLHSEQTL